MSLLPGRIRTAFHLFLTNRGALGALTADEIATLARYDQGWAPVQTEVLTTALPTGVPQDWSPLADVIADIKAENPDFLGHAYGGSAVFRRPYEPLYPDILDADLMVGPDGTTLVYVVNDVRHRWPQLMVGEVRERLAAATVAFCQAYNLDGLFFDNWTADYYALQVASEMFSYPGGTLEGPYHTSAAWLEVLATWTLQAQAALEAAGLKLYINGLGVDAVTPPTGLGALQVNTANYATGVLHEAVYSAYKSPTIASYVITAVRTAVERGAEVHFWAMPQVFTVVGSPTVYDLDDPELERFYFNLFMQCMHPTLTYYGYHDGYPYQTFDAIPATMSVVEYRDAWDLEYGTPTGRHQDGGTTGLWWREFTRGVSVFNPTATGLTFWRQGQYRVNHPTDGQRVTVTATSGFFVPAYTGAFLFDGEHAGGSD